MGTVIAGLVGVVVVGILVFAQVAPMLERRFRRSDPGTTTDETDWPE